MFSPSPLSIVRSRRPGVWGGGGAPGLPLSPTRLQTWIRGLVGVTYSATCLSNKNVLSLSPLLSSITLSRGILVKPCKTTQGFRLEPTSTCPTSQGRPGSGAFESALQFVCVRWSLMSLRYITNSYYADFRVNLRHHASATTPTNLPRKNCNYADLEHKLNYLIFVWTSFQVRMLSILTVRFTTLQPCHLLGLNKQ